jgi:hypothetical protein
LLAGLLLWLPAAALAQEGAPPAPGPWAVTFWGGWGTDGDIEDLPGINSSFEKSWFAGIGLSREIGRMGEDFAWEVEAIAVKHFGWQRHWEGDLAIGLRWTDPPWNGKIRSSLAVATGVSLASRLPPLEETFDPPTKQLLQFLALEAAFSSANRSDLEYVLRLHHRSAVFGLYGTDDGGSNFLALGFRKRF